MHRVFRGLPLAVPRRIGLQLPECQDSSDDIVGLLPWGQEIRPFKVTPKRYFVNGESSAMLLVAWGGEPEVR
jgi:hypothetical protein